MSDSFKRALTRAPGIDLAPLARGWVARMSYGHAVLKGFSSLVGAGGAEPSDW
ncbi:MAG: hypothetical protein HC834_02385 [Rhodospirillales bacterium]|nr:hypothetical protein [Rhodospirillales bacterium]